LGITGQRALGQVAVADFAAAGGAEAAHFADAVGREVVVQDEALLVRAAGDGVQVLGVIGGAEGDRGQGLGFAAVEEGGAVDAGQESDLGGQGADFVEAAAADAALVALSTLVRTV
jgi:hypothetical protein